jgi:hypothetical protein
VLDRAALRGDLEKMFRTPVIRPQSEIPVGHRNGFEKYWQLSADGRSAASFPYVKWFRDHGLEVVAAMLSSPEKGSFLPRYGEKIEHVRGWCHRGGAQGVAGYLSCLWQPYWPCLEATWPGHALVAALVGNPSDRGGRLYKTVAQKLAYGWSAATTGQFLTAAEHFEFGDLLDPFWKETPIRQRLAWLAEAGWLEDDTQRATRSLKRLGRLGERSDLPRDPWAAFAAADLAWRARAQLALTQQKSTRRLHRAGEELQIRFAALISPIFKPAAARAEVRRRYHPWLQALRDQPKQQR